MQYNKLEAQKPNYGVKYKPYYYKNRFRNLKAFANHFESWAAKAFSHVQGNIGHVRGIVLHLYHGTPENRQYLLRFKIIADARFDPYRDIALFPVLPRSNICIWEWATFSASKQQMHRKVMRYFANRKEE
mmetsp:Transcript_5908/g.7151  ORF Transcript_5908/g.7151 Transcript_5908/m.7151 type:complete len:130 (+) Transcript_5908:369-758(+)